MSSQPTESNVKTTLPIVKISFLWHNRQYEMGIQQFLKELGANFTDEAVLAAAQKILSKT